MTTMIMCHITRYKGQRGVGKLRTRGACRMLECVVGLREELALQKAALGARCRSAAGDACGDALDL